MIPKLKENVAHGTKEYPYDQYCLQNIGHPFQIPVHWHEEMEIIYVCRGNLAVRIGGTDIIGRVGDIFFVNPRELHLMGTSDLDIKYYTLLFPLTFVSCQTMDEFETKLLLPLRQGQLFLPMEGSACKCAPRLRELVEELIQVNHKRKSYIEEGNQRQLLSLHIQTRALIMQILQELVLEDALIVPPQGSGADRQRELLAYIQEHYMEKITLEELAGQFHLSPKYISRFFKQHFSLSFSNYLLHLRLTRAKYLLESTEETVTDIALQVGFFSVSHFIRSFKGSYGISPLQYRKTHFTAG